jgi:hypothetical protein
MQMASAAQERANRLNATRSTGARTEAGKEKTKFNATRHGMTSRQVVLFSEDKEDYEELRRQFYEDHKPVGKTEETLVDEIAQCWWRLQRARFHESGALNNTVVITEDFFGRYLGPILRYMSSAERGWHRAITQLRTVQNDRRRNEQLRETATPQPQPIEPEKVMAIGSVSQNDPEPEELQAVAGASHPASPPVTLASEPATDNRQLTTGMAIGSVSQNHPEPATAAQQTATADHPPLVGSPA